MLSRDEMVKIIAGGGSVLHGGRIISREADLPSEADLAQGDPARAADVAADLQAQIAALQAQVAQLQAPTPTKEPKAKAKDAPPAEAKAKDAPPAEA
jgi:hypothetical protein